MRVVLIDDDAAVRENLRTFLGIYCPEVQVIAEADGVQTGIKCLADNAPDLVLLDVEMQDGTGFDLLAIHGTPDFQVIFVTGHDAYAIKAIRCSAIDYLLKPVDPDLLIQAVNRAQEVTATQEHGLKIKNLQHFRQADKNDRRIVLKDAENIYLIAVCDIVRCVSEANYTRFYLVDGREILISRTLKEYDQLLEDDGFFRAHQSHLISLRHFDRFEKRDGGTVYMKDGSQLPVAVRKRDHLLRALEQF